MKTKKITILAAVLITCGVAAAQTRQAVMVGGGNPDWGRCTAEIVVDGAAMVDIRGATATLRDISGSPPQWRRFECTSPMPLNPVNVRFTPREGRGTIEMVRDPREGGVAAIRMNDPQGGANVYGFEISWNNRVERGGYPDLGERRPDWGERDRGRFTADEAIHNCQEAVRGQVADQYRGRPIDFRRTAIDDTPGRGEWVTGRFAMRRYDGEEILRFSCFVDFGGRRVREAHFEPERRY